MRHHPDGRTSGVMKLKCLSTIHLISCLTILLHHPDLVSCVPQFHFQPNDHRNVRGPCSGILPVIQKFRGFLLQHLLLLQPPPADLNPGSIDSPSQKAGSWTTTLPAPPSSSSPASSSPSLAAASQSHRQSVQEGSNCGYGVSMKFFPANPLCVCFFFFVFSFLNTRRCPLR